LNDFEYVGQISIVRSAIDINITQILTSYKKAAHSVAALTNALELDRPDAGGMLPDTITFIPKCSTLSDKFSSTPLMPHKK
jgi:hypothetical protein